MPRAPETIWSKVDFLIVTAVQDEFDELVGLLQTPPSYEEPPDAITSLSRVRSKGIYKIAIIRTGQTNAIAQAAVTEAIKRRDPRAVILTGIAAGFPESGVELGDVLIPSWIVPYEHAKITEKGRHLKYQHRGKDLDVAALLWAAADLLKNDPDCPWAKNLRVSRPETPGQLPKIHANEKFILGSGDKLVASEFAEARKWLRDQYESNALGLEMESYGVTVACRKAEKPLLVVKASQDPGTAAKDVAATKDQWRQYAAAVAATSPPANPCGWAELAEPGLAELRADVFRNATELKGPLWLPSNFAIHMGVISKDRFLLLRKRQSNRRTPYSGAWEAGIGEFMHGPFSPDTPDFLDSDNPSLQKFLLRTVNEELKYDGAQIQNFTVHGFALERLTLAPKLLVIYRSDATIDSLMEGALGAKDYAWDVDKVELSATAVATTACESYYREWGPTSKLTMMLALTADLVLSDRSDLIRNVHEIVQSIHARQH